MKLRGDEKLVVKVGEEYHVGVQLFEGSDFYFREVYCDAEEFVYSCGIFSRDNPSGYYGTSEVVEELEGICRHVDDLGYGEMFRQDRVRDLINLEVMFGKR
ncbi:MAG: hypothetical protein KJ592_03695 [Nanoarchaeota archaeon]|nr:hypothetical protein [Nanoarchaeota archaeon]